MSRRKIVLTKEKIEKIQKAYKGITDDMDDLQFTKWIREQAEKTEGFNRLKDKI